MCIRDRAKSTEKLSSGYKINRAADDAAGLSISEKMRKQIRGLTQASSNAQDGISAVPVSYTHLKDLALVIEEMLNQRIQGVKNESGTYITPAFPKLIYVCLLYTSGCLWNDCAGAEGCVKIL